ncbi:MAG: acyltransferase [Acidobacteria bacterium]|nr:acyltransferase [Acidobacteriota bacterium]
MISRKRANIFDGLRFGAAFLLALGHVAPEALLSHSVRSFLLRGIVSTTFFALSGFILCQTAGFRGKSWRSLNAQRLARLYPLHLFACLLYIPFLLLGKDRSPVAMVAREYVYWITCLQAFRIPLKDTLSYSMNGPAWSVTPLLFGGFLLPVMRSLNIGNWSSAGIAGSLAGTLLLRISMTIALPYSADSVQLNQWHLEPLPHILEMLAGGITALLILRGLPPWLEAQLASGRALALAAALIFVPLVISIHFFGRPGAFYFVHGPVFPFVLLLVVTAFANRGPIDSFCGRPWIKTAGDISMPLFLFHMPVHEVLVRVTIRLAGRDLTETIWGVVFVLAVTLWVSYLVLKPAEWARRKILVAVLPASVAIREAIHLPCALPRSNGKPV